MTHHQIMYLQLSWIEQRPSKAWVGGSNPSRYAIICGSIAQFGQSTRLITEWSLVRVQLDPPFFCKDAPFVQWLGHQIFTLETGVQFPYGVPWKAILIGKEPVLKTGVVRLQSSSLQPSAIIYYAQIAQSVEQGTENPRVGGSIPPLGTIFKDGRIAQLGEHLPYKQGVIGSSPIVTTIKEMGVQLSWLERLPVTQEVASSSLVTPAIKKSTSFRLVFLFFIKNIINCAIILNREIF